jgi:predicted AAA+ superfamily ATPase
MVFVAGPRQVGKTTLALSLPRASKAYLNWDVSEHREKILKNELPTGKLWIFDELHKYRRWRNYLKGLFDARPADQKILVTGSGRLDLYRFGGDSLQGRYHLLISIPSPSRSNVSTIAMASTSFFASAAFLNRFWAAMKSLRDAGLANIERDLSGRTSFRWSVSRTSAISNFS